MKKIDFRNYIWRTREGKRLKLHQLTDNHLLRLKECILGGWVRATSEDHDNVMLEFNYRMKRRKDPNDILKNLVD